MATYLTPSPVYVRGKYLGITATTRDPATIEVPDDVEPSRTWTPLDEAAQKALLALGRKKVLVKTEGIDPQKDKLKYDRVAAEVMKEYTKEIPKVIEKKVEVREIQPSTNAEIAAKTGKVVGRNADKSPV